MNLYLISQSENNGYDTYDSAVVVAENEEDARNIHPSGKNENWGYVFDSWCSSPNKVKVEYIGKPKTGTLKGILLASFNAG